MRLHNSNGHMVDILFSLSLFFVFAASAVAAVLFSLQAYREISSRAEADYMLRTSSAYVTQKLRHADGEQSLRVGELDGRAALILAQTFENEEYLTYIYEYQGELKELFVKESLTLPLSAGTPILKVEGFIPRQESPGVFNFTFQDAQGGAYTLRYVSRTGAVEEG